MKTKEFIKRVEELGYSVTEGYVDWVISRINKGQDLLVAIVNKNNLSRISTDFVGCWDIPDKDKSKLLDIIVEFTKTPIGDREEKEYYLKHRWIKGHAIMYLYRNELNGYCYLGENKCRPHKQRRFTLKDIEEIKEKINTDLADFELVEVEE